MSYLELRERLLVEHERFVSTIRISVGVASNFADVFRFMCFLQRFVDRSVNEIGRADLARESTRPLGHREGVQSCRT